LHLKLHQSALLRSSSSKPINNSKMLLLAVVLLGMATMTPSGSMQGTFNQTQQRQSRVVSSDTGRSPGGSLLYAVQQPTTHQLTATGLFSRTQIPGYLLLATVSTSDIVYIQHWQATFNNGRSLL
jgi:protein-S-isoprenylcysteine O-methyltransferase Ste14